MPRIPRRSGSAAQVEVIVLGLVACLCLGAAVLGSATYLASSAGVAATPVPPRPSTTPRPTSATATALPSTTVNSDTLQALESDVPPSSDLREEAMRLKNTGPIPEVVATAPANYLLGQELKFNAFNQDTRETFQVQARLIYETANVYFFSQEGVQVDIEAVKALVDTFQNKIYPTNRVFFGSEWTPGVDGDPHLYILYTGGIGSFVAGYFSSADEYSHLAHPFSNEKEMFYINADNQRPGDPNLLGVLAHEFQHMIAWHRHRDQETWMNEGSSVLAEMLNGYAIVGFDAAYTANPDLQLNAWAEDPSKDPNVAAHYGAGFLFMAYFLDRFGQTATQALMGAPTNGMRAVDDVLALLGAKDQTTGNLLTSTDVFADWTIANYLGDPSVGDGRYAYHNYPEAPLVDNPTDTYADCPTQASATVHQFGAVYYEIACTGKRHLSFAGGQAVLVVPTRPSSGRYLIWSNRCDECDPRMTHEFDLTGLTKATLHYDAWWELEKGYDFTYLEVSTDGGINWTILKTPSGTDDNTTGNNFGWGYTGNSGGGDGGQWLNESVDLSAYAGQKVQLRFETIADTAVNWPGFVVDDISIPELKYAIDFESDVGGWNTEGYIRMDNTLPQRFVVQVILQGGQTTVQRVVLDAYNQGNLDLDLSAGQKAILVISGVTPFTTELASFQFSIR